MKKRIFTRIALLLAIVLMFGGIATACSSGKSEQPANNAASSSGTKENAGKDDTSAEPVQLKLWHPLNPNAQAVVQSLSDVAMVQEWEKKTNVKFDFEHPTGTGADAQQQFGVMVASNVLPDLIVWNMSNFQGGPAKLYQDGTIIKLNDLIDQHAPNLKKILEENPLIAKQIKADNGDIYVFPNLKVGDHGKYKTFSGQMIRKDWLDELGLQLPETIDEWELVLKTIKEKKGVIPYTSEKDTLLGSKSSMDFIGAYGIGKDFYLNGDKIQYGPLQPAFKDYLARMQKWYQEGLIDPDYASNDNKAKEAKITSGKAASTFGYIGGSMGAWLPSLQQADPKAMLSAVQYPVLNKGDEPKFTETGWDYSNTGAVITSANKNPEATIKALDYLFSEEGAMLKNFGIDGTTYTLVDGQPKFTDLIMKNPDGLPIGQAMAKNFIANYPFPGPDDDRYNDQYYSLDAQKEAVKAYAKFAKNSASVLIPPVSLTPEEASEFSKIMTDVDTYRSEIVTKLIMGTSSLDSFDKAIEQFKKMGIERAIEIQQAAFDRFNKR
ncbi:extracellular solute-binding protein [Paenibacillus sp. PL91]|uniref:extracellular solute-binding protein n=1 Tax=Paenibacillus sp. PL91 TaxID=2729538 RepID=UPI00145CB53C|nr:extracellular solute-binding protein [Paenibacillus sp. PL91]MBC9201546.1 extracellular solute-binding protein [Paenibacillus sp. PL91]